MLTRTNSSIQSAKANILDRANDLLGQLIAAMVGAGIITVLSDNNPADGSAVARAVTYTMMASTRVCKLLASGSASTITITHFVYRPTFDLWYTGNVFFSTTLTTTIPVYLFQDAYVAVCKVLTNFLYCVKTVTSWLVSPCGSNILWEDSSDTYYNFPPNLLTVIKSDAVTSVVIAIPGLLQNSLWNTSDAVVPDQCYWSGYDKLLCTAGNALEVTSGSYLFCTGAYARLGRME